MHSSPRLSLQPAPLSKTATLAAADNTIFVLGAARSGTTWLGKIFDSHPDVLYRHEPDMVLPAPNLPLVCDKTHITRYRSATRSWVHALKNLSVAKTAASLPAFRKSYHGRLQSAVHPALVIALRMAGRVPWFSRISTQLRLAQCLAPPQRTRHGQAPHVVIKSVCARGRAGLLAQALPESRFILLLRHPCGQVASILNGEKRGKFARPPHNMALLDTPQARRHGLTRATFAKLSRPEQLAWDWVLGYEKALEDLATTPHFRLVRFEDLCRQPHAVAQKLFAFTGLDWSPQTGNFIARSTTHRGPDFYYEVMRHSADLADRWRSELDRATQEKIIAILRRSQLAAHFNEDCGTVAKA